MAQSKKTRKEKKPKKAPEAGTGPEIKAPMGPMPFRPPGFGDFGGGTSKGRSAPVRERPFGRRH